MTPPIKTDIQAFTGSDILCVIDMKESSAEALRSAIRIAEINEMSIKVLYPYRLTDIRSDTSEVSKKSLDSEAGESFTRLAEPWLRNSGVNYEFRAEVGFIKDRVHAFSKKNSVGLIVLSKEIANNNKDGLSDLLDLLDIPVLIVPQSKPTNA